MVFERLRLTCAATKPDWRCEGVQSSYLSRLGDSYASLCTRVWVQRVVPDPPGDKDKQYTTSLDLQMLICKTHSRFWIRGWGPPLQYSENFTRGRGKAGMGFSLRLLTERWHWNLKRKDSTRSSCDHREREGWGLAVDTVERRATSRQVVLKIMGFWTPLHS